MRFFRIAIHIKRINRTLHVNPEGKPLAVYLMSFTEAEIQRAKSYSRKLKRKIQTFHEQDYGPNPEFASQVDRAKSINVARLIQPMIEEEQKESKETKLNLNEEDMTKLEKEKAELLAREKLVIQSGDLKYFL